MRQFIIVPAERGWLVRSGERCVQPFADRNAAIRTAVLAAHSCEPEEGETQVVMLTVDYEAYPVWISGLDGLSCEEELALSALEFVSQTNQPEGLGGSEFGHTA